MKLNLAGRVSCSALVCVLCLPGASLPPLSTPCRNETFSSSFISSFSSSSSPSLSASSSSSSFGSRVSEGSDEQPPLMTVQKRDFFGSDTGDTTQEFTSKTSMEGPLAEICSDEGDKLKVKYLDDVAPWSLYSVNCVLTQPSSEFELLKCHKGKKKKR